MRNTPTQGMMSSPAQRLLSRRTQTLLSINTDLLMPQVADKVPQQKAQQKERQAWCYNKGAKDLLEPHPGDTVRIEPEPGRGRNWQKTLVVTSNGRSYTVQTEAGGQYRRNRRQLRQTNETKYANPTTTQNQGAAEHKGRFTMHAVRRNVTRHRQYRQHLLARQTAPLCRTASIGYSFISAARDPADEAICDCGTNKRLLEKSRVAFYAVSDGRYRRAHQCCSTVSLSLASKL